MDLSSLPPLKEVIKANDLLARKSLGQHFLLDANLLSRIAKQAGDLAHGTTIEVGPGPGGLTRALLQAGASVIAVEKDARCVQLLQPLVEAAQGKLQVIEGDAMEVELDTLGTAPRKIVANLPYNVGSVLLVQWLEAAAARGPEAFSRMTLMFQKEVADRIAATSGKEYGRLSVLAQWLCRVEKGFDIPPGAFLPPPKIDSSVISLVPRDTREDIPFKIMEKVIASAFGQRRKMLRAALKTLSVPVETLLANAEIDGTRRAEQLSVEEFCRLAKAYLSV